MHLHNKKSMNGISHSMTDRANSLAVGKTQIIYVMQNESYQIYLTIRIISANRTNKTPADQIIPVTVQLQRLLYTNL